MIDEHHLLRVLLTQPIGKKGHGLSSLLISKAGQAQNKRRKVNGGKTQQAKEPRHIVQKASPEEKVEAQLENGLVRRGNSFFEPGSNTPVMAPELYRQKPGSKKRVPVNPFTLGQPGVGSGHKSESDMYLGQMFQSPAHFDAEGNLKPLDEDSIVDENAEFEDLEEQD